MKNTIFHIDVNSAFLSWTAVQLLESGQAEDIREIPCIIGGSIKDRHGVVLAKSIPAKKFGIRTGEPITHALRKCETLKIVPPDHSYYKKKSKEFIRILESYTYEMEQVSIDEAYLDVTGILKEYDSPLQLAEEISKRIHQELSFTVNIGISECKVLAKMASDFQKPNRIHTLFREEIPEKMWPLPVEDLYMVGKASAATLRKLGITTIGELAHTPVKYLEDHLKSHGRLIYEYANGIDDQPVQLIQPENKGIGNSVTLPKDITEWKEADRVLLQLAEKVSQRLRESGQKASMVSVEIKYFDFTKVSHQMTLPASIDTSMSVYETACSLYRNLWNGKPVRLIGIRTSKLSENSEPSQLNLFEWMEETSGEKQKQLDQALDEIRKKYGKNSVVRASLLKK